VGATSEKDRHQDFAPDSMRHVKADNNVALSEAHGQTGDLNISLF
jgi:hypothetical protein